MESKRSDLKSFFKYIGTQLAENAHDDCPLFQPIAKQECHVSELFMAKFHNGFDHKVGEHGWRKLLVIKNIDEQVMGHIDLRRLLSHRR
ncbi:hypothetical protein BS333_09125 [Vibrio azureus]|uniref:hypothetical protein n=1 Tax=Vibrio azureus TaxID=512649 RepID=UPI0006ACA7CD|nr:hypothetical protein [Vibrio azureus]AUI86530.1 hypothetical protein BS333_09125 [Vibrio azureus]